ncbi:hypothetical protein RB200_42335, partial [Streptomyces sp. PmtG]
KLRTRMREAYRHSDRWRAAGGPPAAPKEPKPGQKISLFRPVVYDGSALVLYALRQQIGRPAFERLERAWVRAHRDGNATTADFTRLASHVSGRDLSAFFSAWLYGTKTPPMPGHPDWTSEAPAKQRPARAGGGHAHGSDAHGGHAHGGGVHAHGGGVHAHDAAGQGHGAAGEGLGGRAPR